MPVRTVTDLPLPQLGADMRRSRALVLAATTALFAGVGLDTALSAGAAGGTFGTGTPEFVNSAAPSDIDQGLFANVDFAGEPSIGVNWNSGAALYQASNSTYKVTFNNGGEPPPGPGGGGALPLPPVPRPPPLAPHPPPGPPPPAGRTA